MPAVNFTYRDDAVGKKISASIDGCPKSIDVATVRVEWGVLQKAPGLDEDLALVVIDYLSKRFPDMGIPNDIKRLPR